MAERTLILLRHAKSDWSGMQDDIDRPLAKRGRRQAPEAGRWLANNIDRIDLAIVSPAKRARSTWELASAELGQQPQTRFDDRVYAAPVGRLLVVVRELTSDVEVVVLVGHNPGIQDLASFLTDRWEPMPTSALAVIESPTEWSSAGQSPAIMRASGRPPSSTLG